MLIFYVRLGVDTSVVPKIRLIPEISIADGGTNRSRLTGTSLKSTEYSKREINASLLLTRSEQGSVRGQPDSPSFLIRKDLDPARLGDDATVHGGKARIRGWGGEGSWETAAVLPNVPGFSGEEISAGILPRKSSFQEKF